VRIDGWDSYFSLGFWGVGMSFDHLLGYLFQSFSLGFWGVGMSFDHLLGYLFQSFSLGFWGVGPNYVKRQVQNIAL
jgi:hypothetical protein